MCREHAWIHKKNCSWTPKKLGTVYLSLCVLTGVVSTIFFCLGMWLVAPFGCLEIMLLGAAFLIYARHAADYERITIQGKILYIEQHSARRTKCFGCNLEWSCVEWGGPNNSLLFVRQGQIRFLIGRFLTYSQRKAFATNLLRYW
jgi:uncharacterized membrane protein